MARYTDANCRLCRRKDKLFLKGKDATAPNVQWKNFPPGQHGQGRRSRFPNTDCSFAKSRRQRDFTDCRKHSSETSLRRRQNRA